MGKSPSVINPDISRSSDSLLNVASFFLEVVGSYVFSLDFFHKVNLGTFGNHFAGF